MQEIVEEVAWLDRDLSLALQVSDETEKLLVEHGAVMNRQEFAQAMQGTCHIVFWKLVDCLDKEDTDVVSLGADETCNEVGIFLGAFREVGLVEGTVEGHPGVGILHAQRMSEGMMERGTVGGVALGIALDKVAELLRRRQFSWRICGIQINHVLSGRVVGKRVHGA